MIWMLHIVFPILGASMPPSSLTETVEITVPFETQSDCLKSVPRLSSTISIGVGPSSWRACACSRGSR